MGIGLEGTGGEYGRAVRYWRSSGERIGGWRGNRWVELDIVAAACSLMIY